MSIQAWATSARSSTENQSPEKQSLIDVYQALLENKSTPVESAHSISVILEPFVKSGREDCRVGSAWDVLCDVVRHLGSDQEISKRLIDLLDSIKKIEVKDEHGNDIKYWGRRVWTELPAYALTFREYGIDIESDEEMNIDEWVGQKSSYFNATSFAATCLAYSDDSGMSFYIKDCMSGALDTDYDTPEPRFRAAVYVPAVSAWISIAGQKIYEMCKDEANGFNMVDWNSWEKGLGRIAEDGQIDEEVRNIALNVKDKMRSIQKGL